MFILNTIICLALEAQPLVMLMWWEWKRGGEKKVFTLEMMQ